VVDTSFDEIFEFFAVHVFQHAKTIDIQRLGEVQGMGRETEGNNAVVFAEFLEFGRKVVFVVVEDDHAIYIFPSGVYMFVEMLNPI
jgi:hypothetical protein